VNLGEVDDLIATRMRQFYKPEAFNEGDDKTSRVSSGIKRNVKRKASEFGYDKMCWICETNQIECSVAHIIRNKTILLNSFGLPWDTTNFLILCGIKGAKGTCHHLFDNFQISFIYVENNATGDTW
jgi:hypothetical protein